VAHITGNLAILAAHLVAGTPGSVALLLSVPVFVLVLGLTRLLVAGLDAAGPATLRPLLFLQLLLLAGFLALAVAAGPHPDPNAAIAPGAGMLALIAGAYVAVALTRQALAVTATYGATRLAWTVTIGRQRTSAVPQAAERRAAVAGLFGEIEERLAGAEDLRANGGDHGQVQPAPSGRTPERPAPMTDPRPAADDPTVGAGQQASARSGSAPRLGALPGRRVAGHPVTDGLSVRKSESPEGASHARTGDRGTVQLRRAQ
jgi:hypothetical protein